MQVIIYNYNWSFAKRHRKVYEKAQFVAHLLFPSFLIFSDENDWSMVWCNGQSRSEGFDRDWLASGVQIKHIPFIIAMSLSIQCITVYRMLQNKFLQKISKGNQYEMVVFWNAVSKHEEGFSSFPPFGGVSLLDENSYWRKYIIFQMSFPPNFPSF